MKKYFRNFLFTLSITIIPCLAEACQSRCVLLQVTFLWKSENISSDEKCNLKKHRPRTDTKNNKTRKNTKVAEKSGHNTVFQSETRGEKQAVMVTLALKKIAVFPIWLSGCGWWHNLLEYTIFPLTLWVNFTFNQHNTYLLFLTGFVFFLLAFQIRHVVLEHIFALAHFFHASEALVFAVLRCKITEWRPVKRQQRCFIKQNKARFLGHSSTHLSLFHSTLVLKM